MIRDKRQSQAQSQSCSASLIRLHPRVPFMVVRLINDDYDLPRRHVHDQTVEELRVHVCLTYNDVMMSRSMQNDFTVS